MPYKMHKQGQEWCIKNTDTGESKGCSKTREMAVAHMRALYAAKGGAKMGKKELDELVEKSVADFVTEYPEETVEFKSILEKGYVPYGITSFAELDKYRGAREFANKTYSLTDDFNGLIWGIMNNTDIQDKASAVKSISDEYAQRIKVLEKDYDENPNNGEYEGGEDKDKDCLNCDQLKTSQPEAERKEEEGFIERVKNGILDAIKSVFKIDPPAPQAELGDDFTLFKDNSGKMHFLVAYSNNIRDDDHPREIISDKSHRRFVEMVDKGQAAMPELWTWHRPEWKFGQATWVAYDEVDKDTSFTVAAGDIDEGCEEYAEYLSNQKGVRLSHGMPIGSIRRDPADQTVILEHRTKEISLLPDFAAANKYTYPSFVALRDGDLRTMEDDMSIPKNKIDALKGAWGEKVMPFLEDLQKRNAESAVAAAKEGRDTKEKDAEVVTEVPVSETISVTPVPITTTETVAIPVVAVGDPVAKGGGVEEEKYATIAEISEAFASTVQPFIEEVKQLRETVGSLSKEITALKADQSTHIKQVLASTPSASVAAMIAQHLTASTSKETEVKKNSKLAGTKPAETQADAQMPTGIPFIDAMLNATPNAS